jgi:hypothetical protein
MLLESLLLLDMASFKAALVGLNAFEILLYPILSFYFYVIFEMSSWLSIDILFELLKIDRLAFT